MKSFLYGAIFSAACVIGSAHAQGSKPAQDDTFDMPPANWLLVQTADSVTFDGNILTLKGISPQAITDRPQRMTGSVDTQSFVGDWGKGNDSLLKDPPNASLSSIVDEKEVISVVELTNPKLSGDSLSYAAKVLQGAPPKAGAISTLFIDWWMGPRGGICRHNAWGGTYCVPSYGRYPNPRYYN
ncbi:MAG: hypothetical protein GEU95_26415 [Rhizobiales bacterium]|nr:hypothetical protein [Hyphomicrobiales bacterium]